VIESGQAKNAQQRAFWIPYLEGVRKSVARGAGYPEANAGVVFGDERNSKGALTCASSGKPLIVVLNTVAYG
jgi:hypothetical protein